jgi:hypothetical protein
MSAEEHYGAGAGTATAALAFGGTTSTSFTAATEEWTGAGASNKNIYRLIRLVIYFR